MRLKNIVFLLAPVFGISILCSFEQVGEFKEETAESQQVVKNELAFKKWLIDTCSILKKNEKVQNVICQYNKSFIVAEDSLSLELHEIICKTIDKNDYYSKNTIVGAALSAIKDENVKIPKRPFLIRIAYIEFYDASIYNSVYEKSYEYAFLSIIPIGSNTEVVYNLIKGNVVGIKYRKKKDDWIPFEWR